MKGGGRWRGKARGGKEGSTTGAERQLEPQRAISESCEQPSCSYAAKRSQCERGEERDPALVVRGIRWQHARFQAHAHGLFTMGTIHNGEAGRGAVGK